MKPFNRRAQLVTEGCGSGLKTWRLTIQVASLDQGGSSWKYGGFLGAYTRLHLHVHQSLSTYAVGSEDFTGKSLRPYGLKALLRQPSGRCVARGVESGCGRGARAVPI